MNGYPFEVWQNRKMIKIVYAMNWSEASRKAKNQFDDITVNPYTG